MEIVENSKSLGLGGQAAVYLARVPQYPFDVVAKIFLTDDVMEIASELDCLMRVGFNQRRQEIV